MTATRLVEAALEGESPKDFLKRHGSSLRLLLKHGGWTYRGSDRAGWTKTDMAYDWSAGGNGRKKTSYVWYDAETKEWVLKIEGQRKHFGRWCGWHELQLTIFKTEAEMVKWLRMLKLLD